MGKAKEKAQDAEATEAVKTTDVVGTAKLADAAPAFISDGYRIPLLSRSKWTKGNKENSGGKKVEATYRRRPTEHTRKRHRHKSETNGQLLHMQDQIDALKGEIRAMKAAVAGNIQAIKAIREPSDTLTTAVQTGDSRNPVQSCAMRYTPMPDYIKSGPVVTPLHPPPVAHPEKPVPMVEVPIAQPSLKREPPPTCLYCQNSEHTTQECFDLWLSSGGYSEASEED